MIEILKKLAELNYSDEKGNPAILKKLPAVKNLEDGYIYHEDIKIHHFRFHIYGRKSSCSVMIEEMEPIE